MRMFSVPRAFVLAAAIFSATAASANVDSEMPAVKRAIDAFVRPAYVEFLSHAAALRQSMDALCARPKPAALEMARSRFGKAVEAWSVAEIIRFGPITEQNRMERLLFWPDRKGIALRQVQAAIAQADPTVTEQASLAGKSVAMQGFGALEFVLFGTGAEDLLAETGAHRCAYGRAISSNIERIASDVSSDWSAAHGFAEVWAQPGPDNPLFKDEQEAMTELLEVFVNGLEMVRDVRINGFLGAAPAEDKPRSAIFWRSGHTVDSLEGNVSGLQSLFDISQIGGLLPEDKQWLAKSIDFEFDNADKVARQVRREPIADVLADPGLRAKLDYFRVVTTGLSDLFGRQLAAELNLTAGFSSLDGD